jgi:16S rRNA (cytosine1402-N4)-methyltransferase
MNNFHIPVLLKETIELLQIKKGDKLIDATIGGGGHTEKFLNIGASVLGIDWDDDSIAFTKEKFAKEKNLVLAKGNFKDIDEIARLNNFTRVNGVLFDLGTSSHQIDTPERGFSFSKDGPLDMRMDKGSPVTAETLLNLLGKGELNEIFSKLGQEHRSFTISNSIIRARRIKAIKTTRELGVLIEKAYGIQGEASDFLKNQLDKKVFQALRIAVNNELENISQALPKAYYLLEEKGRIALITFHSLEDAVVKNTFKEFERKKMGRIITKKPIGPSREEEVKNSRAKSAKLRVFEKN